MVYRGTNKTEIIWVGEECSSEDTHYIELIKSDDDNVFYVTDCCNEDWSRFKETSINRYD